MGDRGNTMVRRQLGNMLRRLREQAGKTQEDVAETKIMSDTTLWRIEKGKVAVKQGDVLSLARFYGLSNEVVDVLVALADATRRPGWWEEFGDSLPPGLGVYAGLEGAASSILSYHVELVPGLLQTPEYARAVIRVDDRLTETVVDQRLAFRLERQNAVLGRDGPARIEAILSAGSLALVVGSGHVMETQIAHLRAIDAMEHVSIRVLPWTSGAHTSMRGGFTLLDFDDPDDPATVHIESLLSARYIEQPEQVAEYRRVFDALRKNAVTIEEYTVSSNTTPWIKATASDSGGTCVEQRRHEGLIEVRDTKDHGTGPTLRFTPAEMAAWLDGAKRGEFDHLI